ncbi:SGNH/GDSL hydrolase family protein [bacterium]|nr:SGNH/GDSL hydrolase family protein [candidate division CSSED10-310 bacterium]
MLFVVGIAPALLFIGLIAIDYSLGLFGWVGFEEIMAERRFWGRHTRHYYGLGWEPHLIHIHPFLHLGNAFAGEQFNSEGFRVRNPSWTLKDANVWILGGSVMWGVGLACPDTIPNILERSFEDLQAYNFGFPGGTSENCLKIIKHELDNGGRPDLVIYASGLNDSFPGKPAGKYQTLMRSAQAFLWKNSRLWWLLSKQPDPVDQRNPSPEELETLLDFYEKMEPTQVSLDRYLEIHREFINLSKLYDFELLTVGESYFCEEFLRSDTGKYFTTISHNQRQFTEEYYQLPKDYPDPWKAALCLVNAVRFQDALQNECKKLGVPFARMNDGIHAEAKKLGIPDFDLFQKYPLDSDKVVNQDPMHPDRRGMLAGTNPIIEKIKELGWKQQKRPVEVSYELFSGEEFKPELPLLTRVGIGDYLYILVKIDERDKTYTLNNSTIYVYEDGYKPVQSDNIFFLSTSYKPAGQRPLLPNKIIEGRIREGNIVISANDMNWAKKVARKHHVEICFGVLLKNIALV